MFYEHPSFKRELPPREKLESAIVVLEPSESKRLIAKALAVLPEIKAALKKGVVIISWGGTDALVYEEIMGKTIPHKTDYTSGVISEGYLNANPAHPETKMMPVVLKDGRIWENEQGAKAADKYVHPSAALNQFKPGDVFIKGANALDVKGDVGILVAADTGGSIAQAWFAVTARGGYYICPVGLEKLIPSVSEASQRCGLFRYKYSMGMSTALIPFSDNVLAVTEIQAIQVLSGARATHVASGGIGGSEGAVVLVIDGEPAVLEKAFNIVKSVKGEAHLPPPRRYAIPPPASLGFDAEAIRNQRAR